MEEGAWFHLYGRDTTKTSRNRAVETVCTVIQLVTVVRTRWLLHDLNRRYRGIFNEPAENLYHSFFAGEEAVAVIEFPPVKRLDFPNVNKENRPSL